MRSRPRPQTLGHGVSTIVCVLILGMIAVSFVAYGGLFELWAVGLKWALDDFISACFLMTITIIGVVIGWFFPSTPYSVAAVYGLAGFTVGVMLLSLIELIVNATI